MDRVTEYPLIVRDAVLAIAAEVPDQDGIRTEVIGDDSGGHYEVLQVGWHGPRRIHGILIHCDVADGKITIEHDGTDIGLADMLIAKGIPSSDIVLGFHQPELRKYTPFAAA